MNIHQFVKESGGQHKAAELLGTNRQQIQRWLKRGIIVVDGRVYAPVNRLNTTEQFKVEK